MCTSAGAPGERPVGWASVSSSYSSTPSAYTSVDVVSSACWNCSGAAYRGVSASALSPVSAVCAISAWPGSSLAMPKSSSLTLPSPSTRMFDGFRSRWMTSWPCAAATASSTCRNSSTRSRTPSERAVAPAVDVLALDQLEHEIRLAARGDAGVEQLGDAGLAQAREDRALAPEPLLRVGVEQAAAQQLDGGVAFEAAVAAARAPDAAHAALADHLDQRPGADRIARRDAGRREARGRRGREEAGGARLGARAEQLAQLARAGRVVGGDGREAALALGRCEIEQLVDPRAERGPARRVEDVHGRVDIAVSRFIVSRLPGARSRPCTRLRVMQPPAAPPGEGRNRLPGSRPREVPCNRRCSKS